MSQPQPEQKVADFVRRAARTPDLISERAKAAALAAPKLRKAGQAAQLIGHIVGDGRTAGTAARGDGDDAMVAIGVLARIAADLLEAASVLLSGTNHYAGAALLRQTVEVEYLTWAFANQKRDAAKWLNSTPQDRRSMFTPARLRSESDGLFLSADYGYHCEQGGHPVPRAIPLLGNLDSVASQLLLVDLLLHSWRTSDNIARWATDRDADQLVAQLRKVQTEFANWGRVDPLYAWTVQQRPLGQASTK